MKFHWSNKESLLTCFVLLVASSHAQSDVGHTGPTAERTCESLRREMSQLFEQFYQKMPTLLETIMGFAHDPNTGKRAEFGVDVLKNMIVNTFTSFLPPCSHLSHMRDHSEYLKASLPTGYLSKLHRSMSLPLKIHGKGSGLKRERDGLIGTVRRRRSSGSDGKYSSDAITIGDAVIPLDIFQYQGNEEEEKGTIDLTIVV